MSGKVIKALPLTVYDIGSTIAHGQTLTFNAGRVIDLRAYRQAILVVRLHSFFCNTAPTNPSWEVKVLISGFTAEDEKAQFTGASVADTGLQTAGVAPAVFFQPFSTPFGSEVAVQISFSQNNSSATVCSLGLSVDIVAKC